VAAASHRHITIRLPLCQATTDVKSGMLAHPASAGGEQLRRWRALFRIENDEMRIYQIEHRKNIYR
jgi:hypothetical protein